MTRRCDESPWRLSDRYDPKAVALADRHYNRQKPGTPQFLPAGTYLALVTADRSAVWATVWPRYAKHAWPGAWMNTLFRNERSATDGGWLSSDLIRWAVAHTRAKWPDTPDAGIITFVNETKVRGKADPGYCYLRAGWHHAGRTGYRDYLCLQQLPHEMPDPAPVPFTQQLLALDFGEPLPSALERPA